MNREALINALQNQPDQRIWQIICNHCDDYNFVFGSVANVPGPPVFDQSDEDYAQRCVEFVGQLQDTFHLPDLLLLERPKPLSRQEFLDAVGRMFDISSESRRLEEGPHA